MYTYLVQLYKLRCVALVNAAALVEKVAVLD